MGNKAWLIAQGFSQRREIDYDEKYLSVMDIITFNFLISLVVCENSEIRHMDVMTTFNMCN